MTRSTRPVKRHDLSWRRCDLVVLIVLALAAGVLLGVRAADRPVAVDRAIQGAGPRADQGAERIDPNVASTDSLRRLPEIGPVLANAIVESRRSGPFKDLDDLRLRVRGIGPATASTIAPFLTFGPGGK